MTKDELNSKLQAICDDAAQLGITVYAVFKDDEVGSPKKLDIDADSLPSLMTLFIDSIRETILEDEELSVLNLSSSDERANAIYVYDLDVPDALQDMNTVVQTDDLPVFDFSQDQLSTVETLLIEIGNDEVQVVLYKTMAPVNVFTRSSFFLRQDRHRLGRMEEDFIRVSSGFQLLKIDEDIVVIDLSAIERVFGFHDIIVREAKAGVDAIEQTYLLENPELIRELVDEISYARKLTKVAKSSPVLRIGVPNSKIIDFCKTHPALKNRIRFNETGDKIKLDTNVSKNLFIKLMMDDFLTSQLTDHHYTSHAKDDAEEGKGNGSST